MAVGSCLFAGLGLILSFGKSVGLGYFIVAVFTTVLVMLTLVALKPMEDRLFPVRRNRRHDDPRPQGSSPE